MRRLRRWLLWFVLLLAVLVVLVAVTPQGRTGVKAVLFIPQVVPAFPFQPQELFTRGPTRTDVHFPIPGGQGTADLYVPARGDQHGAVLLFLGVNPAGRDDERVVGLAEGLARAGMVVMIPWSEHMTQKRMRPEDIEDLVFAFQFLQLHPAVDAERVGMGGFCVGASFSVVAATDPRISDQVKFINFFGGYYDAADLVAAIASQTSTYQGTEELWEPGNLTREVFINHLIEGLSDAEEQELLRRVYVDGEGSDDDSLEDLSAEGEVVRRLLEGVTPAEAEALLRQLPSRLQQFLDDISPSVHLAGLQARVLIMHDQEDNLVPVEESRRLRDALEERGDLYYTEFAFLQHMDPTRPVSLLTFVRDVSKLYLHMYNVLRTVD